MEDYIDLQNQDFSFLGKNSKIKGIFNFLGPTRIASTLEGEIHMKNEASLCLEKTAHIKGTITCHDVEIFGTFDGTLTASGQITIYPPSKIKGDISAKNLRIYPGAQLNIEGHTTVEEA